jgi:hypothetical protein
MHERDWKWVAATAWITGLAALLCDHFEPSRQLAIDMRMLFGIVVGGAISLTLIARARALTGVPRPELHLACRLLSRWVYILMYTLAVVRVGLYLYEENQLCTHCGAAGAVVAVRPLDDFQFYVACCVLPLWVVRAVVLAMPHRQKTRRLSAISNSPGFSPGNDLQPRPNSAIAYSRDLP